jgi:putative salt-induced outer membrane protein YdiY
MKLSLNLFLFALGWAGLVHAQDDVASSENPNTDELVIEETVNTEEPSLDTPVETPEVEEPAVEPETDVPVDEPVEEPVGEVPDDGEPTPVLPKRPKVDPELRRMYLGSDKLGSPSGPRALKPPAVKKTERSWRSEVEAGATGYRGNTDSELFLLKLKTERKKEHESLRFSARGTFGNKDGERDRENGEVEAALRRKIEGRWYYTAEARYFTDKIADVDYQVVTVLSPGYEFIKTDDTHLSLELGPAYIAEEKGGVKKDFTAMRIAILMDKLIDERILVWERFEYLPAIEDASVYLIIAEVGVESILSNWFSLRTVVQQRYDSNPAEDKEKQDIFLSASLVTAF